MTQANYGEAKTEKQSELRDINYQFQELGKRLSEALSRLTNIGNKLSDESGSIADKELVAEKSPKLPGLLSDLHYSAIDFKTVITKIEQQIGKLDGLI